MKQNYSWIRTYYRQFLSSFIFAFVIGSSLFAQTFVNGQLGTSATSNNGTAAPAGAMWHELQHDVVGQSNNTLAVAHAGTFSVADDFVIPAGETWSISTLRAYSLDATTTGTTSPYTGIRVRIWSGTPGAGGTIVYGDLTTNRFAATAYTAKRGIFNSQGSTAAPTPNVSIFQIDATINTVLSSGTYWVEWQVTTAATFAPTSQTVGIRSLPSFNARQNNGGVWAQIIDLGNPATAPDVPVALPFTLNYVVAAPCSGAPTPGNTITSAAAVCPGQAFNLSIQNNPVSSGITYQWQSGPTATGPFTNITGATSSTYSTTATANTYYQAVVSCGTSSATSTPVLVTLNAPSACYCTAGATSTAFEKISNVTFNTINNNSTATAGYENFTAISTNLTPGFPQPISVSISGGFAADQVIVWIDYNQNGSFTDAGEQVYTSANGVGPHAGTITVPFSALTGATRMRVRMHDTSLGANATSCGTSTYGQVEDYTVNILPVVPCTGTPAPGNTLSTLANACAGNSFTLSLQNFTSGSGVTYQWQSATTLTGTYTNIAGATNATYTTTLPGGTRFYRAIVTCGTNAGTSTPVQVALNPFTQCYCIPTPATNCALDDRIANVTIGTLNNNSGCTTGGYTNYTTTVAATDIIAGGANPMSVTVGPGGTEYVGVWIDYDKDGLFETTEFTLLGSGNGVTINGAINVPATAPLGQTGMRVRVRYNTTLTGADACLSYAFGETEDYLVNIAPCVVSTVTTQPPATTNISCSGTGTIRATIAGSLNMYQWQVLATGAGAVWTDLTNNTTYSGVTTNTLTITNALPTINGYQYRVRYVGACTSPSVSSVSTLAVGALAPTVSNTLPINRCTTDPATAISIATPVGLASLSTTASGTLHTNIPDNNNETTGQNDRFISNNITVANIPAGSTVTGFNVKLNITHNWVGDLILVLKAPNGKIINLAYALSGTGGASGSTGFTNTVISSTGTAALSTGTNPYTATFRLDNAGPSTPGFTPTGPLGFNPNTILLADMYQGNGTWTLALYDYYTDNLTTNFLENWELNLTYTGPTTALFAPSAGLFTDAAGTIAYTGQAVNTVYANPTASTTYTATVSTAVCGSGTVSIPVNVGSPLSGTSTVANVSGCQGGSVTFSSTAPTGGLNATSQWQVSTDNGVTWTNIAGATGSTYTISGVTTAMTGRKYRVVRTVASCTSTLTSSEGTLTITVPPTATITAPTTTLIPGQTTTLSVAVTPNAGASYQWFLNGVLIPGATSSTYIANVDGFGNYTVKVIDVNGCSGTSAAFAINAGTSENVFIYPSPNTGQFQVRFSDPSGLNSNLSRILNIYDSKGSRVYTRIYAITQPFERMDVDLRVHGKGIYTVDLTDREGRRLKTGRVVIF